MRRLLSSALFAGFAGALFSAGAAQAGCELEKVVTLPAKIDNGRVFIPGAMDGHPVDYMVDLASRTMLLRVAAEAFTVKPTPTGTLDKLAVFGEAAPDQMKVEHLPIHLGGTAINFGAPQQVALLGIDFFANYDVEYDVPHGKITLYKPTGCEKAKLAYWPGPVTVADMVANGVGANIPPFTPYNFPHMNIRIKVHGQDMVAALDSGYAQSSMSLPSAHSVGLTVGGEGMVETAPTVDVVDGYSNPTWLGTVDSIDLGGEIISSAKIRFHSFMVPPGAREARTGTSVRPSRYHGADLMLGADFLIAHRIMVSQSQTKIYFSPAAGADFLGNALSGN